MDDDNQVRCSLRCGSGVALAGNFGGDGRRTSALEQLIAENADLLHAYLQQTLGGVHAGDGGLDLLDAGVQLGHRSVGVEQAARQDLDGGLDFGFQDVEEAAAERIRLDGGLVQAGQQVAVGFRVDGPVRVEGLRPLDNRGLFGLAFLGILDRFLVGVEGAFDLVPGPRPAFSQFGRSSSAFL